MQVKFKKGEVVWAKIRGFPWWPGMIALIEDNHHNLQDAKILVNFIGDKSHAELTLDKLEKFKEKYEEFSKTKQNNLIRSIQIANKIYNGDLTYENHFQYIKQKQHHDKSADDQSDNSSSSSYVEDRCGSSLSSLRKRNKRREKGCDRNNDYRSRNDYYKKPEINSISTSALMLEGGRDITNLRRLESKESNRTSNECLKDILDELTKNTISLPSTYNDKLTLDNLNKLHELLKKDIDDSFNELIFEFAKLLDNLIDKKNTEISRRATELMFSMRDKLIADLFNLKNRNLEEIFAKSIKNFGDSENFSTTLTKKQSFRKGSINSTSNLKGHRFIIEELASFLSNREKNCSMLQPFSLEKTADKSEKPTGSTANSNSFNGANCVLESTVDEKTEGKEISSGTVCSTIDGRSSKFFEKELPTLGFEKEKEKVLCIFREIKDKYLVKKDVASEKVYAQSLDKDQVYSLFHKYFIEKNSKPWEIPDFYSFLLSGNYNDSKSFLGKKSKRKDSLTEKDLEKNFYVRKGICQHLSKVLNKLIPQLSKEHANQLSLQIENNILSESNWEPSSQYEKNIRDLFNKIKNVLTRRGRL